MIYTFKCDCGERQEWFGSIKSGPPPTLDCPCGESMSRDWAADKPYIDASACRDHDDIPEQARVQRSNAPSSPEREERRFAEHIKQRRAELKDGNKGSFRHTHSVPADLYHGKKRETGDPNYWKDPKNLARHKSCRVDT